MESLKGKTAVVTGATSGIGLAISCRLIQEGVYVTLVGRDFTSVANTLENLVTPGNYQFISCDLADDADILKFTQSMTEKPIDILIHSAGVISLGEMENSKLEDLDLQYKINVRAPFLITRQLINNLRKSTGDIVFVNSTAGIGSWENISQYSASKHALRALTDSFRKEVLKDRIRVSSLYLGSVDTPMQEQIRSQKGTEKYDASRFMKPNDIADATLSILKLSKRATVTDITLRQNF